MRSWRTFTTAKRRLSTGPSTCMSATFGKSWRRTARCSKQCAAWDTSSAAPATRWPIEISVRQDFALVPGDHYDHRAGADRDQVAQPERGLEPAGALHANGSIP